VNASNGKPVWKFETTKFHQQFPAITGNLAVFGGCDGFLHFVNTDNGKPLENMRSAIISLPSAAVFNNKGIFWNITGIFFLWILN